MLPQRIHKQGLLIKRRGYSIKVGLNIRQLLVLSLPTDSEAIILFQLRSTINLI